MSRPPVPMRLRHIELFHAIMQTGSLSGAAHALGMAQPSASKMLAYAEQTVGFALFTRTRGLLRPTREAELLFIETKRFQASVEGVRKVASNLATHPGGQLRIGCIPSLGLGLIPRAVRDFTKRSPGVKLEIQTNYVNALCEQLLARELDVAVAFDPPPVPGIIAQELGRARVVYLAPPDMPTPDGPIKLQDLPDDRWIGIGSSDPLGRVVDGALAELGLADRIPAFEVRTYYLARALVDHGVGYALVDEFTAMAGRESAPLNFIDPPLSVGVFTLTANTAAGLQAAQLFTSALRDNLHAS